VRVGGEAHIDPRQYVLAVAVDGDHAALPGEFHRLDDIGRVGGADQKPIFRT